MSTDVINIYCDESCHMLNDRNPIMTLGAIAAPKTEVRTLGKDVKEIKNKYNCRGELKWTKVSSKNISFYLALVDLLFEHESLSFRSLIVCNKEKLNHEQFNRGDHDTFYYKMYYYLIRNIIEIKQQQPVHVYIDIKDTKSAIKIRLLNEVLANRFLDFERTRIQRIQQIRSHESELLQLCDFVLGAVTYANRDLSGNYAKCQVVKALEQRAGHSLRSSTPPWEPKFNLFHFVPRENY